MIILVKNVPENYEREVKFFIINFIDKISKYNW